MRSLFGRAGSVTEEIALSSELVDGGQWSQDYCIEPRCYLVLVPQLMGINGKSLSWMGLTRERWCCTRDLVSRLDMNTCQTSTKSDILI